MTRSIALGWLVALAGCVPSVIGTYDPRHFEDWPIDPAKKLDGCAIMATTADQDAFTWRGSAASRRVSVPVGVIAREAAVRVIGDLFRGGMARPSGADGSSRCRVVITPRVTGFEWREHFFGSPDLRLHLTIEARSASGATIVEKQYDSGTFRPGYVAGQDVPAVVSAAHVAMQSLMLKAAADLKTALEGGAPPVGGEAPPRG